MKSLEKTLRGYHPLRDHARVRPDGPALIWCGATLSWTELDRASDAFAIRMQALGVKKGDPAVLFLNNCPQYVVAHYGIQKIGAIVCPSGLLNKAHELGDQVSDAAAVRQGLHRYQARRRSDCRRAHRLVAPEHGHLQGARHGCFINALPATGAGKVLRRLLKEQA